MRTAAIFDLFKQVERLKEQGAHYEISPSTGQITITWDDPFLETVELTPTDASAVEWHISSPQWAQTDSARKVMLPVEAVPGCLRALSLQQQKHTADWAEFIEWARGYHPQAEYRAYHREE